MTFRTLDEINRDFMSATPANKPKSGRAPFNPRGTRTEIPKRMRPGGTSRRTAGDVHGGMSRRKTDGVQACECRRKTDGVQASESRRKTDVVQARENRRLKKTRSGLFTTISDTLFSLAIVMILLAAFFTGTESGAPRVFFGYSYFAVMSNSMQNEIPQGSFILVKHVDPQGLRVGDNITYMTDRTTSVTHKIVGIYENYNSSGARGFQTRGVNNENPDRDIVYEAFVVGKVVLVLPVVGAILSSLDENVFLVFLIFGICVFLSFLLRGVFAKPGKTEKPVPGDKESLIRGNMIDPVQGSTEDPVPRKRIRV